MVSYWGCGWSAQVGTRRRAHGPSGAQLRANHVACLLPPHDIDPLPRIAAGDHGMGRTRESSCGRTAHAGSVPERSGPQGPANPNPARLPSTVPVDGGSERRSHPDNVVQNEDRSKSACLLLSSLAGGIGGVQKGQSPLLPSAPGGWWPVQEPRCRSDRRCPNRRPSQVIRRPSNRWKSALGTNQFERRCQS